MVHALLFQRLILGMDMLGWESNVRVCGFQYFLQLKVVWGRERLKGVQKKFWISFYFIKFYIELLCQETQSLPFLKN